jgi:hypothetical protein
MILAWLSHGVTFFTQVYSLISEIVEQRERGSRFFRGSEGERQKKGEIRTEGLGMFVGVRELAKATRRVRIGHR